MLTQKQTCPDLITHFVRAWNNRPGSQSIVAPLTCKYLLWWLDNYFLRHRWRIVCRLELFWTGSTWEEAGRIINDA